MQNLRENSFEIKLIGERKNKLTNGHGGMIIQLRAAIFERIQNVQIQALQTVFISLLSIFMFFIFDSNATDVTLIKMMQHTIL